MKTMLKIAAEYSGDTTAMRKEFEALLGKSPSEATEKEIKSAYRKLSKIHHPDRGGNSENFKALSAIYEKFQKGIFGDWQKEPFGGSSYKNQGGYSSYRSKSEGSSYKKDNQSSYSRWHNANKEWEDTKKRWAEEERKYEEARKRRAEDAAKRKRDFEERMRESTENFKRRAEASRNAADSARQEMRESNERDNLNDGLLVGGIFNAGILSTNATLASGRIGERVKDKRRLKRIGLGGLIGQAAGAGLGYALTTEANSLYSPKNFGKLRVLRASDGGIVGSGIGMIGGSLYDSYVG